jgi:hypothetical protein
MALHLELEKKSRTDTMEKRMEPFVVSTKSGLVWIEQSGGGEDAGIAISPEQVPILIKWLKDAAAELEAPVPGQ